MTVTTTAIRAMAWRAASAALFAGVAVLAGAGTALAAPADTSLARQHITAAMCLGGGGIVQPTGPVTGLCVGGVYNGYVVSLSR
ncbi:hypothetical protein [Actinomadura oligospora]|uniref:hypothetical protein n=1 Tax=Actinomadura oligospora TaxID=111804 RepID=UPI00047A6AD4|nr:hypothetical protein [Actinomadura oligospora]